MRRQAKARKWQFACRHCHFVLTHVSLFQLTMRSQTRENVRPMVKVTLFQKYPTSSLCSFAVVLELTKWILQRGKPKLPVFALSRAWTDQWLTRRAPPQCPNAKCLSGTLEKYWILLQRPSEVASVEMKKYSSRKKLMAWYRTKYYKCPIRILKLSVDECKYSVHR